MTEYLNKSFSVCVGGDQEYRDNWDRIFAKKKPEPVKAPAPPKVEPEPAPTEDP